ncbi:MAG: hypothetical protein K2J40_00635 [Ruminococcus sp.]|nr:hypothetical protein [Ruminococcus sp.]
MEKIQRYLKYGFEKILTIFLVSDKSNISVKKRMELIESLLETEEFQELPKIIKSAYVQSLEKIKQIYYYKK